MKPGFTTDDLVEGVVAFVLTLRHTMGCSNQEIKNALNPKMIDLIFEVDDKKQEKQQ